MDASPQHILLDYTSRSAQDIRKLRFAPLKEDILALGCDTCLELVHLAREENSWTTKHLRTILLGSRVTALDFTASTSSTSEQTYIEILVACADKRLRLISCYVSLSGDQEGEATIEFLSSPLSGKVTDVACCRAPVLEGRAVSVSEDGSCVVWNLRPEEGEAQQPSYSIPHPYPVNSAAFHPEAAALLMTCDCRNTIRLLEWNDDTSQTPRFALCDPKGVVSTATRYRGHADWKSLDGSVFGSVAGSEWVMWDVRQGDKPIARGEALGSAGADGFLWSPTNARQFAIFSSSPKASPPIKVIHTSFPSAPRGIVFPGSSRTVADVRWHPSEEVLCCALGNTLVLLPGQM